MTDKAMIRVPAVETDGPASVSAGSKSAPSSPDDALRPDLGRPLRAPIATTTCLWGPLLCGWPLASPFRRLPVLPRPPLAPDLVPREAEPPVARRASL